MSVRALDKELQHNGVHKTTIRSVSAGISESQHLSVLVRRAAQQFLKLISQTTTGTHNRIQQVSIQFILTPRFN